MAKYIIRKTSGGQFWWVLAAANGNILITGETYTSKQNCLSGVAASKVSISESNFRRLLSVRHEPYFTQNAANGQVLGTSEMYSTAYGRDNGIESVKQNAFSAVIEDLT